MGEVSFARSFARGEVYARTTGKSEKKLWITNFLDKRQLPKRRIHQTVGVFAKSRGARPKVGNLEPNLRFPVRLPHRPQRRSQARHHLLELSEIEGLRTVRKGALRAGMNFYDNAIGYESKCGT